MGGAIQQRRIQAIAHERIAACLYVGTRHSDRRVTLQAALLSSPGGHPQHTLLYANADVHSSGAGRIGEARSACSRKLARLRYVDIRSTSCINYEAVEYGLAAKRFRFMTTTEDL